MTFSDVLPTVRALPRADRLRLIQIVAQELADAETPDQAPKHHGQAIWSAESEAAAAEVLTRLLAAGERKP